MEAMRAEALTMSKVPVDREYTGEKLHILFGVGTLFGIIASGGGCMLGLISGNCYGAWPMAFEQTLYVISELRGRGLVGGPMAAFEAEASSRGAVEVHVKSSTGIQDQRTARMYGRLGYVRAGFLSRKEINV